MNIVLRNFFLLFIFFFFFTLSPTTIHAIDGCFCSESSSCYPDGCTRKTIKSDGSIDYGLCGSAGCNGAYNCCYNTDSVDANRYFCTQQPPCCAEMVKRNDPEACCWPERGYCHPFYCEKVSRPEKCGWYWSFHGEMSGRPQGYGCTKGTSAADLQPVYGLPPGVGGATTVPTRKPTQYIPPPTAIPTIIPPTTVPSPYLIPTVIPLIILPTISPTQYIPPTLAVFPTVNPSPAPSSFNVAPLKLGLKNSIVQSEKILNVPAEAVNKIVQVDLVIENTINKLIEEIVSIFVNKINQRSFFSFVVYASVSGCHCNDPRRCYEDGCTRKTWQGDHLEWEAGCNENFCGGGAYNCCYDTNSNESGKYFCLEQPPCCFDMVKIAAQGVAEPAKACCFPEIGYCHPYYCDKVGNPGGCGHYWKWHGNVPDWMAKGYGCVIGTSEENMKPLFGLPAGVPGGKAKSPPAPAAAQYVRPTESPTAVPTAIPTQYIPSPTIYIPADSQSSNFNLAPIENITPTAIPATYPTIPPPQTPSFSLPSLSLPSIDMEPLKITMKNTIVQSEKVFSVPAEAAGLISQTDKRLEELIQKLINDLMSKFTEN